MHQLLVDSIWANNETRISALEDLELNDIKVEPNLKELAVVRSANRAALLEQTHFKQAIVSDASANITTLYLSIYD
jgi:hypothetical protein